MLASGGGATVEIVKNSVRYAAERRRAGVSRSASLTTGIIAAGGVGALAVAVGLAVGNQASAGGGTSSRSSVGSATSSSDDGNAVQQPTQTGGGLAPAGNSAPQSQSHGS